MVSLEELDVRKPFYQYLLIKWLFYIRLLWS
jgi:hypothetical protein